jgi:hypothetical protein
MLELQVNEGTYVYKNRLKGKKERKKEKVMCNNHEIKRMKNFKCLKRKTA